MTDEQSEQPKTTEQPTTTHDSANDISYKMQMFKKVPC